MPFRHQARRIYLAPAVGLMLAVAITACSSASSSSSSAASSTVNSASASAPAATPPAPGGGSGAAVAALKANGLKFFSSSTPNSDRVALLENGQTFASAIKSFSSSPLAAAVTSKVDSVTLNSATQASVKYDIGAAGQSTSSTGSAVLQNGTWKVGDDVFCGLLKQGATLLGMTVPAACK